MLSKYLPKSYPKFFTLSICSNPSRLIHYTSEVPINFINFLCPHCFINVEGPSPLSYILPQLSNMVSKAWSSWYFLKMTWLIKPPSKPDSYCASLLWHHSVLLLVYHRELLLDVFCLQSLFQFKNVFIMCILTHPFVKISELLHCLSIIRDPSLAWF